MGPLFLSSFFGYDWEDTARANIAQAESGAEPDELSRTRQAESGAEWDELRPETSSDPSSWMNRPRRDELRKESRAERDEMS
mmetsp:Transcript_19494/g.36519  ORF Transcript_19494/g.36519 Transcript_19494/m.36519 type:complete len:82 (-) Transcript_19494:115-360(-)